MGASPRPTTVRVAGAILLVLAGILALIGLALPTYETALQPDRFDLVAYPDVFDGFLFIGQLEWSFGVPVGFLVVAAAVLSLTLGTVAASRWGSLGVGIVSLVAWVLLGFGGLRSFADVADRNPDITGAAGGVWTFGIATVVGLVGAILVIARPANATEEIW